MIRSDSDSTDVEKRVKRIPNKDSKKKLRKKSHEVQVIEKNNILFEKIICSGCYCSIVNDNIYADRSVTDIVNEFSCHCCDYTDKRCCCYFNKFNENLELEGYLENSYLQKVLNDKNFCARFKLFNVVPLASITNRSKRATAKKKVVINSEIGKRSVAINKSTGKLTKKLSSNTKKLHLDTIGQENCDHIQNSADKENKQSICNLKKVSNKKRKLAVVNGENDDSGEPESKYKKDKLTINEINSHSSIATTVTFVDNSQDKMAVYELDYRFNTQPPSENPHMLMNKSNKAISNEDHQNLLNSKHHLHHHNHHLSNSNSSGYHSRQSSNNSIATLCNIGNTCYLNSVVYTLRFAPFFLHKLHHLVEDMVQVYTKLSHNRVKSSSLGRNVGGLQGQSSRSWSNKDLASLGSNSSDNKPKTNRQLATERLHELYQSLHRNEVSNSQDPFHAGTFLQAVQDVSSIFEGNQQQDAHEFLMLLLDSIRESCQTLMKTITDNPDIITNGYSSLPEQSEIEPQLSPRTVKTSFFSKKIKRKEPPKQNNDSGKLNSPVKDTTIQNHINVNAELVTTTGITATTSIDNELSDKDILNDKLKKLDLDFVRDDFEGITVSKTTCLTCESSTEKKETMIDVSIPISSTENIGAIDNPQLFFENACITKEYFRGANKYRCEACCGYQEAIRSISFEILPRLLVVQLKRFSGGMEKINSYIPTPFILKCFCNKCYHLTDDKKLHVYKLYSVITHVGATMSVGHYIAYTTSLKTIKQDQITGGTHNDNNNNNNINSDYINCPKDKKNNLNKFINSSSSHTGGLSFGSNHSSAMTLGGNSVNSQYNSNTNNKSSKINFNLMKKFKNLRNKTSSSGDLMNKNLLIGDNSENNLSSDDGGANGSTAANSNGAITGITPIIKTTCQGLNCCGLRVCNHSNINSNNNNDNNSNSDTDKINENGDNIHMVGVGSGSGTNGLSTSSSSSGSSAVTIPTNNNGILNGINVTGSANTVASGANNGTIGNNITNTNYINGTGGTSYQNGNQITAVASSSSASSSSSSSSAQTWYMCDDDKIKIMSQREFEEILSPNRKIMITPYLLFYARFDENNSNINNDNNINTTNHNNNL